MNKIKKIAVLFCLMCIIMAPVQHVRAEMWGTNMGASGMKQGLEEIFEEIKKAINSSVKMMSIKQATSTIEDLLYGGSSSPRNISNFEDFIINDPKNKAVTYGEDFLTSALRGTTSGDYTPAGGSSGGDALGQAIESGGNSVLDGWKGKNQPSVDYAEHCTGGGYFAGGDYKCLTAIAANHLNTPIGMALATDTATSAKYVAEQKVQDLTAKSSGVLPAKDAQGNTKIPSSMVEVIQNQQVNLPLEALANGDSNVFSSVIQSFATTLIVGVVERGLGEVQSSVGANMQAISGQMSSEMNNMSSQLGPEFQYSGGSYNSGKQMQQSSTWTNPDTGTTYNGGATTPTTAATPTTTPTAVGS